MDWMVLIVLCVTTLIISDIMYYLKYRKELNKIKKSEIKKGIVEKIELINDSWEVSRYSRLYNELYKLTVKLEDGRVIETNIRRNVKKIYKGHNYTWIPQKGDSIIIYKNEDGSYENNYEVEFRKRAIEIGSIYLIATCIVVIIMISLICKDNSKLITYGDTVVHYKKIMYKSNSSKDHYKTDYYEKDYSITHNSKGQYILNHHEIEYHASTQTTIQEQHKKISKKDIDYILNNHKKYAKPYSPYSCDFYYKTKDEKYCLEPTEDTEKYFYKLLNKN